MSTKIQFVVSTGKPSAEKKKAQRKLVRSHVTAQRYHEKRKHDVEAFRLRNEPQISSIPGPHEATLAEVAAAPLELNDRQELFPRSSISVAPLVSSSVSTVEPGPIVQPSYPSPFPTIGTPFDDFVPMPPGLSPRVSKHLFYYINVLMPRMHPSYFASYIRKSFRCTVLAHADELLLSGLSAFSATSRAMISGDLLKGQEGSGFHDAVYDRVYFKGRTIKLVNSRLSNVAEAISDATISGVCDLIYLETLTGNLAEATAHVKGLKQLAALRQKDSTPMTYPLACKIMASTVKLATLTNTKPIIPFILKYRITLPMPSISHILPELGTKLISDWPKISKSADQNFISTLYDLASMAQHTEAIYDWLFPKSEDESYFEYVNAQNLSVEHRLLSYTPSNLREKCVRLACLLFVNTCLVRGFPLSAAIIRNVVAVLRDDLKGSIKSNDWEAHQDALFWVLFVGAYCTEKEAEDAVLVKAFKEGVSRLSLNSWEEARSSLSTFFYVDSIYGNRLRELWRTK